MKDARLTNIRLWIYLVLVLSAGVCSYLWMTALVDEDRALMRYVRRVTNSVNPSQLQEWAVGVFERSQGELISTNTQTPRITELPDLVRRIPTLGFAPAQVWLCRPGREAGDRPFVSILYTGGFGSWGLSVGDESFWLAEDRHTYEWIPGVYIQISP